MNFLPQGFQKLENYRQTDRQTGRSVTGGELAVVAVVIRTTLTGIVERTCWPAGGVVSARVYRAVVNARLTAFACI